MQVKLRIDKNNKTNLVEMHMAKPYFKTNGTAAVRTQAEAEKKNMNNGNKRLLE